MYSGNEKVAVLDAVLARLSLSDGPEVELSPSFEEELDFDSLEGLFDSLVMCAEKFTNGLPPSIRAKALAACEFWSALFKGDDKDAINRAMAEGRRRAAAKRSSVSAASSAKRSGVSSASSSVSAASSRVSG